MKQNKETLKQFFETGDKPTQEQYSDLIDSYIDAKQPEGEANRRFVIDETGEVSVASEQQLPVYQAGDNITIDNTDSQNPIINAIGSTIDTSNLVPFTGGYLPIDLANNIKLGSILTKAGKARHNVYLKDKTTSEIVVKHQDAVWNGADWSSTSGMMIGFYAGENNTGVNASAYGANSLKNNTGQNSSGFGVNTLQNNEGINSNGFGYAALLSNKGDNSNGFGYNTLGKNTGSYVSGFGHYSAYENTGDYASGFGYYALRRNTGINASGFGTSALTNNNGTNAVGVGYQSLYNNIGHNAVGIGVDTLRNNEGQNNTTIGYNSFSGFYKDFLNPVVFLGSDVDVVTNQITITGHGFGSTGTKFKMMAEPPSFLGGLNSTAILFEFEVVDSNTIKSITNISSKDDVTQYTFSKQLAISNSTTIGANSQPDKSNQVVLGDLNIKEVTTAGDYISTGIGKGLVSTTPDGTKQYRISIDDSGNIVTTLI